MTYHLKNIWKNKKKCPTKRASESTITHVSKLNSRQTDLKNSSLSMPISDQFCTLIFVQSQLSDNSFMV